MNPKELGLKVEDWMGVNRQETREQLQDNFFWTLQNLYERKIGELQRRGGTNNYTSTTMPTNITSIDQDFTLYDKVAGKTKLLKVGCSPITGSATSANVTASFVTNPVGHWGDAPVGITNGFCGCSVKGVQLVATGFCRNSVLNSAVTTGVPVSGDTKTFQVVISAPIGDTNVTGIDVYANVLANYSGGNPQYFWIWIGTIDLIATPTGTFNFSYGPITMGADPGVTEEVGNTDTAFTLTESSTAGSFTSGKTYYVAILAHRVRHHTASNADSKNFWYAASVQSIKLSQGKTSIKIAKTAGGSAASLLAIGTHPQLLRPVGIINNGATFTVTQSTLPSNTVFGVVNFSPVSSTVNDGTYIFMGADVGLDEMFAKVDSNSNWVPIPINNYLGSNADLAITHFVNTTGTFGIPGGGSNTVSTGASWQGVQYFSQTQELLYMVPQNNWNENKNDIGTTSGGVTTPFFTTVGHNIVQSDGSCASMAVMDFGCATPPRFATIGLYQEHLTGSGGTGVARNQLYFSNVLAPYNWGVPGATSIAQYAQCESVGEDIVGHGTYTNTSGLSGPIEQIIVAKKSSLWVLTSLPTYTAGSSNNSFFIELSRKAGCANIKTMVNSEVGTIIAGVDNVWLIRGDGEPTPIGDEIKYFLRSEDPTQTVDPTYWSASYHDGHYKLSYSSPGSSVPNQELWLNIQKMKKLKGQPCWYGPMTGREVWNQMVETPFNDTILPKRWCVDQTNKRWYQADREDFTTDFGTSLSFLLETKIFGMKDDTMNKLFMEQMWKMKADANFNFTETLVALNQTGEVTDANTRAATKLTGYTTGTYSNFVTNCRAKIYRYFPAARGLFGENLKVSWSYTGDVYFTIAMFTAFYKDVRRRPGLSGG